MRASSTSPYLKAPSRWWVISRLQTSPSAWPRSSSSRLPLLKRRLPQEIGYFILGPEGARFDPAVQVGITFTEDEWDRLFSKGYDTTIQRFDNGTWVPLANQTKNETTRTITGWTDAFSVFAPITVGTSSGGGGGGGGGDYRDIDLTIEGMVVPRPASAISTNQPNTVIISNLKNLGADTTGEFTVALYASDVDDGKKPVATTTVESLAGVKSTSNQTTISIVDPTLRKAEGGTVTYRAVIDPDEQTPDTDRSNNEKIGVAKPVKHNGYNGKRWQGGSDVTTYRTHDIHGGLVHSFGDSRYRSGSFAQGWTEFAVAWTADDLPLPSNATVKEARLYVPYTWDNSNEIEHTSLTFNGVPIKLQAWYHDVSNFGAYHDHVYGLCTYDVTSEFRKNKQNSAKFSRKNENAKLSMGGFTLAVVYEDPSAVRTLIFMNEEFDLLGAAEAFYGTTPERTIAYVPFTGATIDVDQVSRAELITFVPWGDTYEGNLYVNGNLVASNVWDFGSAGGPQIAVDTRDIWNYLKPTGNEAAIQSTPVGVSPCMAASQQLLVVEMGGKEARQQPLANQPGNQTLKANFKAEPLTGTVPLSVRFQDLSEGDPLTWEWDFGDGGTVENTTQNPRYVYRTPGNYTVTLTVKNATAEHTERKEGYILVENATARPAESNVWVPLEDQVVDEATRTISGWTRKFSVFAPITVPKASANSTPADTGTGEDTTMIEPLRTTEDVRDKIDQSTGVVSETIVITCGDAAEFTIPEGTVAMANGRPITRLSAGQASADDVPDLPPGAFIAAKEKVFLFEPEGAVFSPPILVSITFTEDEWALLFGENDTTIQRFERIQEEDDTPVKNGSGFLPGRETPLTPVEAVSLEVLLISVLLCVLGAGGLWMGLRVMPANRAYAGVGVVLLLIATGLIAVHALGLVAAGGPGPADLDPGCFSVSPVIERIEDLNPANDLPDYPEGFVARNGLLVAYTGGGGVPLSSLEVELASGGQRTTLTPSSTPPDDPGLNAGVTAYFEEVGNGDGVISSGEWLMVYADGCLIRKMSGLKKECLVWRSDTSLDPLTVDAGDALQYRLLLLPARKEIASGEVWLPLSAAQEQPDPSEIEATTSSVFTAPEDLLTVGAPFIYTDLAQSNEISVCPRSAVTRSTFWYKADGETVSVTAPEGKTHMVVHMRVTHRGNLDGVNYTIETPALPAFTLHGEGGEFMPLHIPANASTSFGEVYTQKTLDRKESIDGSILFEIPDVMSLSDVYLSVDIESVPERPVWVLG
jgi:PKD repeat protein